MGAANRDAVRLMESVLGGLAAASAATVCFGLASTVQARAARADHRDMRGGDLGMAARLVRSRPFLVGTALDMAGFAFSVLALRSLPLFVVQSVTNASLAVTAVAAVWLLKVPLHARDGAAVAVVVIGLVLLALGSGPQGVTSAGTAFDVMLLGVPVAALALTSLAARLRGGRAAVVLGALSGVGFGVTSLAVRVMDTSSAAAVLTDPATYAVVLGGLGGYLSYVLALRHGTVAAATASGTLVEVCAPGLIGILLLHDQTRPGYGWLALAGFLVATAGTIALSRFGEGRP
ncbi:hypothetical protein [Streptomyces sp. NPDC126503]|uniref:hypothetical protein n=1 Tax=Streptomyces sp. NPDC126503 TaxID=3155315 RepID=UPI00331CDBF5